MLKKIVSFLAKAILFLLKNKPGSYVIDRLLQEQFSKIEEVKINPDSSLFLSVPNRLSNYRAATYFIKEPETIEWLESMHANTVLWDIGANVGLYSLYAASQKQSDVIAFEPSVFNLELLARNISQNKLYNQITIFPLALSNKQASGSFNMSNPDWGGALSTFDKDYDQFGKQMDVKFKYELMGVSGDFIVKQMKLKQPDYLKIDVDGVEHVILSGMKEILPKVKSILVEINDEFEEQIKTTQDLLHKAGFVLKKKCEEGVPEGLTLYNQWWINKNI